MDLHGSWRTIVYCTVRLTTVLWVIVPEVALMVTGVDPVGVKGTALLLLEQPAINPADRTKTAKRAKSRMLPDRVRER